MIATKAIGVARLMVVVSELTLALLNLFRRRECPYPKYASQIFVDRENDIVCSNWSGHWDYVGSEQNCLF